MRKNEENPMSQVGFEPRQSYSQVEHVTNLTTEPCVLKQDMGIAYKCKYTFSDPLVDIAIQLIIKIHNLVTMVIS